jgi:hypothetical protein
MMVTDRWELHPLCALFPRMSDEQLDELAQDIAANGLRRKIVLFDGKILDGGNRYEACIRAGVAPRFEPFVEANALAFVLGENLRRRHLTVGQQAVIVASATDWSRAQAVGNPQFGNVTELPALQTVADRAAESGASDKTQRMADKVAKADPELAREVVAGEVSLPAAYAQVVDKREVVAAVDGAAAGELTDDLDALDDLADAVGDFDPIAEYDKVCAENEQLKIKVAALSAKDAGVEMARQLQLNANLQDKLTAAEKKAWMLGRDVARDGKILAKLCELLHCDDSNELPAIVHRMLVNGAAA